MKYSTIVRLWGVSWMSLTNGWNKLSSSHRPTSESASRSVEIEIGISDQSSHRATRLICQLLISLWCVCSSFQSSIIRLPPLYYPLSRSRRVSYISTSIKSLYPLISSHLISNPNLWPTRGWPNLNIRKDKGREEGINRQAVEYDIRSSVFSCHDVVGFDCLFTWRLAISIGLQVFGTKWNQIQTINQSNQSQQYTKTTRTHYNQ